MRIVPIISFSLGAQEVLQANKANLDFAGMQPTYKQLENYDHLIDKSENKIVKYGDGGLHDSLKIITQYVEQYSHQVKKLAKHLYHANHKQLAFNLWHFQKMHIKYKLDDAGKEQLRTPARIWADRFTGVDCDDYTIFTACLLRELGYSSEAFIVAFNNKNNYQHIYSVFNGIVIDAVMNEFNRHPDGITKHFKMEIEGLHGAPDTRCKKPYLMGLAGMGEMDTTTLELIEYRKKETNPSEQRKLDTLIMSNSVEERTYLLQLMPFVQDVTNNGNLQFKDWFVNEYLNLSARNQDVTALLDSLTDEEIDRLDDVLVILEDAEDDNDNDLEGLGRKGKARRERRREDRKAIKEAKEKFGKGSPEHKAAKEKRRERIKEQAKKVGKAIAKVFPLTAAARAAFRGIVALNFGNIAGRLSVGLMTQEQAIATGYTAQDWQKGKEKLDKVLDRWEKMGGKKDKLIQSINKGKNKKPLFKKKSDLDGLGNIESFSGLGNVVMSEYDISGLGIEPATTTMLTAAGTVLAAILPILKGFNPKKKGEGDKGEEAESDDNLLSKVAEWGKKAAGKVKEFVKNAKNKKGNGNDSDAEADDEFADEESKGKSGGSNWMMWAFGAVVLSGGAYLAFKK